MNTRIGIILSFLLCASNVGTVTAVLPYDEHSTKIKMDEEAHLSEKNGGLFSSGGPYVGRSAPSKTVNGKNNSNATDTNRQCIVCNTLCSSWHQDMNWKCKHTVCNDCLQTNLFPSMQNSSIREDYPADSWRMKEYRVTLNIEHECDNIFNVVPTKIEKIEHEEEEAAEPTSIFSLKYMIPLGCCAGIAYLVYEWWKSGKKQNTPPQQPQHLAPQYNNTLLQ